MRKVIKHSKRFKDYPKNVPIKLLRLLRECGWVRSVCASQLQVNGGNLSNLLNKGIEPKDTSIRVKMFLPAHPICKCCKRKIINRKHSEKMVEPDYIRKWKHLSTSERRNVILVYLAQKEYFEGNK